MYLLYIAELRVFHLKNSVVLLYTAIRGGNDAVQKLATFFKNIVFEKRRQFLNRILGGDKQQAYSENTFDKSRQPNGCPWINFSVYKGKENLWCRKNAEKVGLEIWFCIA